MSQITTSVGIIAMAAGLVAVIALLWAISVSLTIRRIRNAQRQVLGDSNQDLVAHAAGLENEFRALHQYVADSVEQMDQRVGAVEERVNGTISYHAVVRYDAYGETSGRQSASIALLDANQTGIVLSSIHHRDHARMYVKQVRAGNPEIELSPEEQACVRLALSGETQHIDDELEALRSEGVRRVMRRGGAEEPEPPPLRFGEPGEA
ncbi:MAG: DUF4446 family protein [Solirubrobacterales bacterium]|nr:DUF4446 family protein [Solirubrobacterales bacterium]